MLRCNGNPEKWKFGCHQQLRTKGVVSLFLSSSFFFSFLKRGCCCDDDERGGTYLYAYLISWEKVHISAHYYDVVSSAHLPRPDDLINGLYSFSLPTQGLLGDSTGGVHLRIDKHHHRRRRVLVLLTAAIMGLAGLAVILTVLYVTTPSASIPTKQLEGFTLEDVLSGRFYSESFNGTWISGSWR